MSSSTHVKKTGILFAAIASMAAATSHAAEITLFDYGIHVDGESRCLRGPPCTQEDPDATPGLDASAFDATTGLGSLSLRINAGTTVQHRVGVFVDHELEESLNGFFDEFGVIAGSAPAGLSLEIDEPGFVFGDIVDNFVAGALDGGNALPAGASDDVALALLWDFELNADEFALVRFTVSTQRPSGFHLAQVDPDTGTSIYFSSDLDVRRTMVDVPAPGSFATAIGAVFALGGLATARRRGRRIAGVSVS